MLKTQHPKKRGDSAYVIYNFEVLGNAFLSWFNKNIMKTNPGKYHLFLSGNDSSEIAIGNKTFFSGKCEKRLGIKLDNNLSVKEHIDLCAKKQVKRLMFCLVLHHQ